MFLDQTNTRLDDKIILVCFCVCTVQVEITWNRFVHKLEYHNKIMYPQNSQNDV